HISDGSAAAAAEKRVAAAATRYEASDEDAVLGSGVVGGGGEADAGVGARELDGPAGVLDGAATHLVARGSGDGAVRDGEAVFAAELLQRSAAGEVDPGAQRAELEDRVGDPGAEADGVGVARRARDLDHVALGQGGREGRS